MFNLFKGDDPKTEIIKSFGGIKLDFESLYSFFFLFFSKLMLKKFKQLGESHHMTT